MEGDIQRAALAQRVALVALALIHADDGAADGVGQGLDGGIGVLAVEEGGGQGQLLVGDGIKEKPEKRSQQSLRYRK